MHSWFCNQSIQKTLVTRSRATGRCTISIFLMFISVLGSQTIAACSNSGRTRPKQTKVLIIAKFTCRCCLRKARVLSVHGTAPLDYLYHYFLGSETIIVVVLILLTKNVSPQYNYDKTIVDSGTTNLRVSEEVFEGILDRLKKFDKVKILRG